MKNSPLDISVSCFANYNTPDNPESVNLMTWLKSAKYADRVQQIRSIDDKEKRDALKATLPAITPSGTFRYRNKDKENFIEHSGLIQFDIDLKENGHISNYDQLKDPLCKINEVAYCGLSAGRGYWGLIPIAYPDKHEQQFWAVYKAFEKMGLNLDKRPRNRYALRGYSYDPDAYFNHNAKVFTALDEPKSPSRREKVKRTHFDNDTRSDVEALIQKIQQDRIDITGGYEEWLKIGFALSDEFGEAARDYFHAVSQYHSDYNERECDRQFTHCLKSNGQGVTISTFFHLCKQHGVLLKTDRVRPSYEKDRALQGKYGSQDSAPYGKNPYTGEIFDKRGYPAAWDELQPLMQKDPLIKDIVEIFDCESTENQTKNL